MTNYLHIDASVQTQSSKTRRITQLSIDVLSHDGDVIQK